MTVRAYVDANVILRFLTKDPPKEAAQSAELFEAVHRGEITLILDEIVIAEVVWVLQSYYGHSVSEIAPTLLDLLADEGLEAKDKGGMMEAIRLFSSRNIDFVDALLPYTCCARV